jgi:hypothetical protein
MRASGTGITELRFVASANPAPYEVEDGTATQQVNLCGNAATYVGIAQVAAVAQGIVN